MNKLPHSSNNSQPPTSSPPLQFTSPLREARMRTLLRGLRDNYRESPLYTSMNWRTFDFAFFEEFHCMTRPEVEQAVEDATRRGLVEITVTQEVVLTSTGSQVVEDLRYGLTSGLDEAELSGR